MVAIIPARYGSTRFPGKPLVCRTGKYLIQHVYERVALAGSIAEVIVATDDDRIFQAVQSFGGRAVMTRADHPSGTDRVAEVAAGLDAEIVVNVQGDEPEIEPGCIDRLVDVLTNDTDISIATLACPFPDDADPASPNAVKVVLDLGGHALYFSRSLIPHRRDAGPRSGITADAAGAGRNSPWLLHLGIYAYRRAFLLQLAGLAPTPLEQLEKLEQLRALEHGYPIGVALVNKATVGVDTPEDYEAFVRRARLH